MQKRIAFAGNVAVALGIITLVVVVVVEITAPLRAQYRIRHEVKNNLGLDFSTAEKTLLLVLRTTCQYCTESMPFYERVSRRRQRKGASRIRLVALSIEEEEVVTTYLTNHQVQVDDVRRYKRGTLRVSGTPTLLLVDGAGEVRGYWVGKLNATKEQEVMEALFGEVFAQRHLS